MVAPGSDAQQLARHTAGPSRFRFAGIIVAAAVVLESPQEPMFTTHPRGLLTWHSGTAFTVGHPRIFRCDARFVVEQGQEQEGRAQPVEED